jgi:CTP:phosphocholine cytidylyltransferase-like protein
MVLVHEKRIIETQLDALIAAGITDITIVRGYHGESFDSLLVNYPKLKFIDNPHWNTTGAIVSAALAIDLLEGAYLIEGDLFINNPNVIRSYEYRSSYCGIPSNVSNDWYFCTDSSEHIQQLGFGTIHKFVGIMFWTSKDVRRLKKDLKSIMQDSKHHQRFIESVPFDSQTGNYDIFARSLRMEEVVEVDTYEELQSLRIRFK